MEKENIDPNSASASSQSPAGGSSDAAAEPASSSGDGPEQWKKKAEERDAYRNELLRAKADLDNFQKRVRRERPAWEDQAVRRFVRDLLPVADNFERALTHTLPIGTGSTSQLEQGVRLTLQMLARVLADHGVEEIPARGEVFNPELHEAVAEVEVSDQPTGQIVEVLEKGYRHRDAVLRPSRVNVARNSQDSKLSAVPPVGHSPDGKKDPQPK